MTQTLTDIEEPLTTLYYGEGGTGKSTHLAHMANLGRIVAINAESGLKARALKRCGVNVKNIDVYPAPDERATYNGLVQEWMRIREANHKKPGTYVGVFWDSLTEITQLLLEDVREANPDRKDERKSYGEMQDQIRSLIRKYRDLGIHFGASALDRRDIDDDGEVIYRPSVNPALQKDLPLWFDEIISCSVSVDEEGEEHYLGLFRAAGKRKGKDRFKVMPRYIVNPTFTRVLEYVEEELTADKDKISQTAFAKLNPPKNTKRNKDEEE